MFKDAEIHTRKSSKGTYASVSVKTVALNANEIIEIYKKASKIKGIISL